MRGKSWCLASILLASAGHAQVDQVRFGPVPSWATPSAPLAVPDTVGGPLFMRRQDVQVHVSDSGQAQYLGYRLKILQTSALEAGNLSIAWNPDAGAPIVHDVRLFRDGQTTDVLKEAKFEILRREDQLEAAKLDGMLTAVLRVPDLRVGDELEVDLTVFTKDPTPEPKEAGILLLAPSPSPGRYHLGVSWEGNEAPALKITPDIAAAMVKGKRAVDLHIDNPPSRSVPDDAPLRYHWQRAIEYSDFADWAAVSRHFAPVFARAATLPADSPVKREAGRIAAAHQAPLERANAALKLVQQDVRYIYVGLNGGNLIPASADETWQRRYGDCKGKTALLLALLAELGIKAEAVLVNSAGADDGFDQRLPNPQLFDHVLVRAQIGGVAYWLDGTLPPVAPASIRPVLPVQWVLPLSEAGSGLEKLAWQPPTSPDDVTLFEFDARAGFDKPARITSTRIVRGLEGLQQDVQFSSLTTAQLLDAFRQNAIGDTWQTIDDVQWHYDQKAGASVLTITGSGTVNWENDGGGAKSLALPGGGFNPPDRHVRAPGAAGGVPFAVKPEYSCYVTTVRLPTSTLPTQWSSKASFDTRMFGRDYHRAWELRDGAIRMIRGSRVEQPEIDVATAERDNGRIAAFDNSMGYISYDPTSRKSAVGHGETVPATYDIDWTVDNPPCLASGPGKTASADPVRSQTADPSAIAPGWPWDDMVKRLLAIALGQ